MTSPRLLSTRPIKNLFFGFLQKVEKASWVRRTRTPQKKKGEERVGERARARARERERERTRKGPCMALAPYSAVRLDCIVHHFKSLNRVQDARTRTTIADGVAWHSFVRPGCSPDDAVLACNGARNDTDDALQRGCRLPVWVGWTACADGRRYRRSATSVLVVQGKWCLQHA